MVKSTSRTRYPSRINPIVKALINLKKSVLTFKPKKGKGSYNRNKFKRGD